MVVLREVISQSTALAVGGTLGGRAQSGQLCPLKAARTWTLDGRVAVPDVGPLAVVEELGPDEDDHPAVDADSKFVAAARLKAQEGGGAGGLESLLGERGAVHPGPVPVTCLLMVAVVAAAAPGGGMGGVRVEAASTAEERTTSRRRTQ